MKTGNLSPIKSLLLTLQRPAKLYLSQQELPDMALKINNIITTGTCFPLWPACADILYNSQSRVFVGVSYLVTEEHKRLVRELCFNVTDEVVRYNDFRSEQLRKPYSEEDYEYDRLEIIWTNINADTFEVAQLDSGFWYYSKEPSSKNIPLAFGLSYIDDVLDEYNLILPENFTFPLFTPEFIKE